MKFAIWLGVAGLAALVIALASGRFDDEPATSGSGVIETESSGRSAPPAAVPRLHEIVKITPGAAVPVLDAPGGPLLGSAAAKTPSGARNALSVAERRDGWIGVESELAGSEPVAWVEDDPERLVASETEWAVVADRGSGALELRRGAETLDEFGFASVGAAGEVRAGRYAVADVADGELVLTATPEPAAPGAPPGSPIVIGAQDAGDGALVVDAEAADVLAKHLPIGAPVYLQG